MGERIMEKIGGFRYFRKRIFTLMLFIAVIPIIALSFFAYSTYIKETTEKFTLSMKASTLQAKNQTDYVLLKIREYYSNLSNLDKVQWLMVPGNMRYEKSVELKEAVSALVGSAYMSDYISGYSFINFEDGWVLSQTGLFTLEEAKNDEAIEAIRQELSPLSRYKWINHLSIATPTLSQSNRFDDSGLLLAVLLPSSAKRSECMMVIKINHTRLEQSLSQGRGDFDITVLDNNGQPIYYNNQEIMDWGQSNYKDISQNESIHIIKENFSDSFRLYPLRSGETGFVYIGGYNLSWITDGAEQIISFGVLLLFIVVIVWLGAFWGSRWLTTPLQRLRSQLIKINQEDMNSKDEFLWLEKSFHELIAHNSSMGKTLEEQETLLRELFVFRLLRGELTSAAINQNLAQFGLEVRPYYRLVVLRLEGDALADIEVARQDALRMLLMDNIPVEVKVNLYWPPINLTEVILFVLAENRQEAVEAVTVSIGEQLRELFQKDFQISMVLGASSVFSQLEFFSLAYHQALEALKQEWQDRESNYRAIRFFTETASQERNFPEFDLEIKREVLKAIDSCDVLKAEAITELFVDGLYRNNLSGSERDYYLLRFQLLVVQAVVEAGLPVNQVFSQEGKSFSKLIQGFYDRKQSKEWYKKQLIRPAIAALYTYRRENSGYVYHQICTLIKKTRGNLSLLECADQLACHPSTLQKVLKNYHTTFTDFVAAYKIEQAKDLLLHSQLSVGEIAQLLHYTNAQNFIRFFSKVVGETPGSFRQHYQK